MKKLLRIYRGLPGSGKSTAAKRWAYLVIEMDQYPNRYLKNGSLNPEVSNTDVAKWSLELTEAGMGLGYKKLAVANTFVKLDYMKPYFDLARNYGYKVEVIECTGNYGSIHNVPVEVIERMREQWEPYKEPSLLERIRKFFKV